MKMIKEIGYDKSNGYMIRAVKKSAKELNEENIGDNVGAGSNPSENS